MLIAESITRLAATLLAIVQNRAQLVATEIEEEALRYFSYLMYSLAAMFCFGMAMLLGILLLIVLYWDTNRIGILLLLMALSGLAGAGLAWRVRNQYRLKPALLGYTITELSHDTELLKPPA